MIHMQLYPILSRRPTTIPTPKTISLQYREPICPLSLCPDTPTPRRKFAVSTTVITRRRTLKKLAAPETPLSLTFPCPSPIIRTVSYPLQQHLAAWCPYLFIYLQSLAMLQPTVPRTINLAVAYLLPTNIVGTIPFHYVSRVSCGFTACQQANGNPHCRQCGPRGRILLYARGRASVSGGFLWGCG